eukprot:239752-Chlamydomonas_euryale.AAC.7
MDETPPAIRKHSSDPACTGRGCGTMTVLHRATRFTQCDLPVSTWLRVLKLRGNFTPCKHVRQRLCRQRTGHARVGAIDIGPSK